MEFSYSGKQHANCTTVQLNLFCSSLILQIASSSIADFVRPWLPWIHALMNVYEQAPLTFVTAVLCVWLCRVPQESHAPWHACLVLGGSLASRSRTRTTALPLKSTSPTSSRCLAPLMVMVPMVSLSPSQLSAPPPPTPQYPQPSSPLCGRILTSEYILQSITLTRISFHAQL